MSNESQDGFCPHSVPFGNNTQKCACHGVATRAWPANDAKLFVVYLGGKVAEGRMGEDHEVVVVVTADPPSARKAAKAKWRGIGDPHVDAVQELVVVDGHRIDLVSILDNSVQHAPVDATWVP